ncbi:membrane protein [Cypionkella aquatica]|uniref:Membrane protein n=1 Tax=Cypionkella aquatica TaxID=1756042 RepID=A0AA37U7K0_9RHOB|nr:DUF998 domain-containing protein [Cypionkella aquatica]GLS86876.1 membrane protein [Cypionkella aquatica]
MEIVAAALFSCDILMLISFQVLNRDAPQFAHAISDYGVGKKTAGLFKAYVIAGALAAPLLAWQFWQAQSPSYPASVPFYLMLVALGRLGLGLFPNDPRGAVRTQTGQIHHAATLLAFTCAFMAVAEATPLLAASVADFPASLLSGLKHLISLGFIAVTLTISAPLRRFFGIAERLFLYATALWFLTASLTLPPL